MIFRGWIPVVAGRVSFSAIGETTCDGVVVSQNLLSRPQPNGRTIHARQAIVLQHRITLDTLFKSRIVGALSGKYGDFYFCFVAGTEMSEQEGAILSKFSGKVFIFRRDEAPLNLERRAKEYSKFIAEWSMGLIDDVVLQTVKQKLIFFYSRHAFASTNVEIDREGTTSIQGINIDKNDFNDSEEYDEMRMVIAHQTYFFLKDISHSHRHHHHQTDTIIECHRIRNDSSIDSGLQWRRDVLFDLFRYVIFRRKANELRDLENIPGVLAYAESFQRLCKRYIQCKHPELECATVDGESVYSADGLHFYDSKHLSASLKSVIDNKKQHLSNLKWLYTTIYALIFGLFAFLQMSSDVEGVPSWVPDLLSMISDNSLSIMVGMIVILIFSVFHMQIVSLSGIVGSLSIRRLMNALPFGQELILLAIILVSMYVIRSVLM